MDFLVLFLLYISLLPLSFLAACLCLRRKGSLLSTSIIHQLAQGLSRVIPARVHRAAQSLRHCLFHTRHRLFVILHVALEVLVYSEYTWEVFGYCQELEFSLALLLLPYLLLTVNVGFFILCSRTDPGVVTKSNQALFLHAYTYDGVMFEKGAKCASCGIRKPARSKHCGACHGCVHRFDHHCVWVNNCIGAFNTRYFLVYLLTLSAMATAVAVITATFLARLVTLSDLMLGHYTDDQGQEHPVDAFFIVQYLFFSFPRIVFMLGFVMVFSVILGSYFCFGLYLVLINQTSYEWFKSAQVTCGVYKNIYSRGVWSNIMEIVKPRMSPEQKRK